MHPDTTISNKEYEENKKPEETNLEPPFRRNCKSVSVRNKSAIPSIKDVLQKTLAERKDSDSEVIPVEIIPKMLVQNKKIKDELEAFKNKNIVLETRNKALESCKEGIDTKSDSNIFSRFALNKNVNSPRSIVNHFLNKKSDETEQIEAFLKSKPGTSSLQTIASPSESELKRSRQELNHNKNLMILHEKAKKTKRNESLKALNFNECRILLGISDNLKCDEAKIRVIIESYMDRENNNRELQHLINTILEEQEESKRKIASMETTIKDLKRKFDDKCKAYEDLTVTWSRANDCFLQQSLEMNAELEKFNLKQGVSKVTQDNDYIKQAFEMRSLQKQIDELKLTNSVLLNDITKEKCNNAQLNDQLNDKKLKEIELTKLETLLAEKWNTLSNKQLKDFHKINYFIRKIEQQYNIKFDDTEIPENMIMEPLGNFLVANDPNLVDVRSMSSGNLTPTDNVKANSSLTPQDPRFHFNP